MEKVTHRGSDWASPIITVKTNGGIRICGDYTIGVNHQICSDLSPLLSLEIASHKLANMKHFVKINLKLAYNQIEIDNKFKEIITLNMPMGLLRWFHLPFGIITASHFFHRASEKIL